MITAAAIGFVYLYVVPQLELEPDRGEAASGSSSVGADASGRLADALRRAASRARG